MTPEYGTLREWAEHIQALPSIGEVERDPKNNLWATGERSSKDTQQEAIDLALHGWPEGARMASEKAMALADRLASASYTATVESIGYDVMGAAFDPGALAQGVPECWGTIQASEAKRAIRIVANICVSGGITPEVMLRRGMAVAAIALVLQAQGFPLTIEVCQGAVADSPEDDALVRVADANSGSPLDVDRVVFALAHPAMFRRLYRAHTNKGRNGKRHSTAWDNGKATSNDRPHGAIDLFVGGVHLREAERWQDGGEAWVMSEYLRQTQSHEGE